MPKCVCTVGAAVASPKTNLHDDGKCHNHSWVSFSINERFGINISRGVRISATCMCLDVRPGGMRKWRPLTAAGGKRRE